MDTNNSVAGNDSAEFLICCQAMDCIGLYEMNLFIVIIIHVDLEYCGALARGVAYTYIRKRQVSINSQILCNLWPS